MQSFYIHTKVTAGARKESFKNKTKDHFEISVKEKAENNMANGRVLELVAEHFEVPVNKVRIINGHHHPSKLLIVES
ncbi:DUF167 domain-containing protein [Candidatus Nomurabacteria bacterium]|nr:DUF167 domain-containing protein [Candidatus Nomurabacteria bacterium]